MDEDLSYEEQTFIERYFATTYLESPILSHAVGAYAASVHSVSWSGDSRATASRVFGRGSPLGSLDFTLALLDLGIRPDDITLAESNDFAYLVRLLHTEDFDDELLLAGDVVNRVASATVSGMRGFDKEFSAEDLRPPRISQRARYWFRRARALEAVIHDVECEGIDGRSRACTARFGNSMIVASPRLVVIVDEGVVPILLSWEHLLSLKDCAKSRFQVFVAASVFYQLPALDGLIEESFEWQERCLHRYNNMGYEIAKSTEALSKTFLTEISCDTFVGESGSYRLMLEKIREKERKLGTSDGFSADEYAAILERARPYGVRIVVELFGLQKMCGHPLIDARVGGLSAAGEARSPDPTTPSSAERLRNNFCRMYLEAFVKHNGRWPPIEFDRKGTELGRLAAMQYGGLNANSYPLSDWSESRFGKHQDFDFCDNYLDVMDDKAISCYRSEVASSWDRSVRPTSQRRLLLEMIDREEVNPRAVFHMVRTRQVPKEWFIVSLYPKEREFKTAARMFAMLVLEMRLFFTVAEHNLAESIFPLMPQQTMTKDKVAVQRMFFRLTSARAEKRMLRMFLEVDLSRWNLRWRELSIHRIGDDLDDIFGVHGVYTFVHEFFSESMIVVRVPGVRPEGIERKSPPESDLLWYNHLGGFEGIAQKHWTLATYSMVDLALQQFPVSYVLIGQGDNQIASIRAIAPGDVERDTFLLDLSKRITARIEEESLFVNQEAKPEECLSSTSVITYSKDVYISGVDYPTTLKAHSRLFPHSTQEFPSIPNNIGAIFASATTAAERSDHPLGSYILSVMHASLYLSLEYSLRGTTRATINRLERGLWRTLVEADAQVYYLTLPSILGGWPIAVFTDFLYKGGADPLGKSIAAVRALAQSGDALFERILSETVDAAFVDPAPKVTSLLKDPFGLPIKKPVGPADAVSRITLETLRSRNRNTLLAEAFSESAEDYGVDLAEALSRVEPFNPLLLHDVYDCSVAGAVETVARMFTATRSIQSIARGRGSPVVERMLSAAAQSTLYLMRRFRALPLSRKSDCETYAVCKALRGHWTVGGIPTPAGVTSYTPFDFVCYSGEEARKEEGIKAIFYL